MYTIPPKKKAHKVRQVDEVATPEHERFVTPDGGEIDKVQMVSMLGLLDRSKVVRVSRRVVLLGSSISKTLKLLMGSLTQWQQKIGCERWKSY